MKRRLEVEPDFYSQEVDDILDALDDFSDGCSDHEGESSQPEEVQSSKNVKSSAISEIKEEILKEKEKIEEEKKEMTKIESSISENDLHGTVKNLPNVKNLDPKDFVVYEKLDQDFRNRVLLILRNCDVTMTL